MPQRDSIGNTILVTVLLCLGCSVVVSGAAVFLRDAQERNKKLYMKKNILKAAGLVGTSDEDNPPGGVVESDLTAEKVAELFETRVKALKINLKSGKVESDDPKEIEDFDQYEAASAKGQFIDLSDEDDIASIKTREKFGIIYVITAPDSEAVEKYVVPVRGYGLWSTMRGFLALSSDTKKIQGITFFDHKETPGLGGEIENPSWQEEFKGKVAYDDNWKPNFQVVKTVDADNEVSSLSGATITSNGVQNMVQFWLSDLGYGKYLERQRNGKSADAEPDDEEQAEAAARPESNTVTR